MEKFYEYDIADMVMERPLEFYIGDERYNLYPVTLGKSYLIHRLLVSLEMSHSNVQVNPFLEAIRLCESKLDTVVRLVVYSTLNNKDDLFNERLIQQRCEYFKSNIDKEDMAKLLLYLLTSDKVEECVKFLGLDKDREDQRKVLRVKSKNSNVINFGGKSVFGAIIDVACERYGWTLDYIVWGISYASLRMLMADMTTSITLTDEERKKVRISRSVTISGDDPANIDKIRAMFPD